MAEGRQTKLVSQDFAKQVLSDNCLDRIVWVRENPGAKNFILTNFLFVSLVRRKFSKFFSVIISIRVKG